MVDPDYVEANPEEAKAEARAAAEEEIRNRPELTWHEKLQKLAKMYEPDMDDVPSADEILTGMTAPKNLDYNQWALLVTECLNDLKGYRNEADKGRLSVDGDIRFIRFIEWLDGQEPERRLLAMKTAASLYLITPSAAGQKSESYIAIMESFRPFIEADSDWKSRADKPIAELIGE